MKQFSAIKEMLNTFVFPITMVSGHVSFIGCIFFL